MQFVKPIAVIHTAHNLTGGLQLAEFAGRLCYNLKVRLNLEVIRNFFLC